jgi:diguanylate cyclase (GGDEF)-like protein/PAS domain S-box-containing protein
VRADRVNAAAISLESWFKGVAPLSSNSSTKLFHFGLPTPRHNLRLSLFIICSICAVWASHSFNLFGGGELDALLLISLLALAYFASGQDDRRVILRDSDQSDQTPPATHQEQEQEQLFRRIFDQAAGMALVAPGGQWLTVNRSLCAILGYSDDELLEKSLLDLAHPDDVGATLIQIEKLLEGRIASHQTEQRFTHKLGHLVWMLLNISAVHDAKGSPSHLVFQFQDITHRKLEEERLVHDVFHDALTGLPNRALFMDRLRLATERARRRKDQVFAMLFLDLDNFKAINDSMGHIMGDQLLIQVSRRLKACLRTADTIARLGGDEFTILLEDLTNERESLRIVERLQKELALPFKLGAHEVQVSASIGVVSSTQAYERAEDMLRDADMAMYRAKSSGKACYQLFDRERHAPSQDVANLSEDLEKAVERDELLLHYQPIVSLETGKLQAFEALVRWQHPQLGLIAPTDFIPLAEENGSIMNVGNWVLREACLQLKRWQERFPFHASLAVSVNLSSKQFMQADLIDQVIQILQETKLDPRSLKLEITESVVMENIGTATVLLQQLRALGIELGVDDFGTGYSSLSYLHRLPLNSLKIDKSFVKGMVETREHAEIVKTILTLARSLGIRVVAEGVETLEQLVELRRLQCDAGQGFLFSKPADVETVETLLGFKNQWQATIASLETRKEFQEPAFEFSRVQARRALLRAVYEVSKG